MKKIQTALTAFVLCFPFFSCAPVGDGKPLTQQSFAHLEPIRVRVSNLQVANMAGADPRSMLPAEFSMAVYEVAERYLRRRFMPMGGEGTLLATIEELRITQGRKESDLSVARFFDLDASDEYHVLMKLRIAHQLPDGSVPYGNVVTAQRRFTIPEQYSIAQREAAQQKEVERLFQSNR
ncbi:MAG: hypothetical protein L6Q57_04930 [Alphaproteobacteria bacterium]|nr:hypothetical protein [Alphaproteobacteria bacterium]